VAISFVQTAVLGSTSSGASIQTSAFAANPTVGNYLVAWAWGWTSNTTSAAPAFSDTGTNAYTIPTNCFLFQASDLWLAVGYTKVAISGATFKVTITKAAAWVSGSMMCVASEFSGIAATSPLDGTAVGTSPGTTAQSFAPGNLTLASGSLVVAGFCGDVAGNPANLTSPSGWSSAGQQLNGTTFQVGEGVYRINPASPANPTWSTTAAAAKWGAAQFALKTATGGAAFVARPPLVIGQAVRRAAFY
jgi:hypothetical protein